MSERDDALRMIQVPVVLMEPEKIDAVLFATKALAGFGERFGWTDEALAAYEQLQKLWGDAIDHRMGTANAFADRERAEAYLQADDERRARREEEQAARAARKAAKTQSP
jgi:hypothetical protein